MSRPFALAAACVAVSATMACASSPENAPVGSGSLAPSASMQPIPDPVGGSRRGSARVAGRAERPDGVNGTLRPYTVAGVTYRPRAEPDYDEQGAASWYGAQHHGRRTASGEVFDMGQATAAHRTLPMGSVIEVTNLDNERVVRLRVNDRGPFSHRRLLDVSREGARQLGFLERGTARVRVRVVDEDRDRPLLARAASGIVDVVTAPVRVAADIVSAPVRMVASALSSDDSDWAVQGGAFSERGNAERLAERLAGAGEVRIRDSETGGRRLYHVLVGGYRSAEDAARGLSHVAALGVGDARVVRAF